MEREPVGKRLRFEVMKRDGFKCRYCGAGALQSPLHVDHVIAVANGGPTEAANLVAACASCNLGKSSVPLGDLRIAPETTTAESMLEHADQVRSYLDAAKELAAAKAEVREWVFSQYEAAVGMLPPKSIQAQMAAILDRHPIENVVVAIDAIAVKRSQGAMSDSHEACYFNGVLRNLAAR